MLQSRVIRHSAPYPGSFRQDIEDLFFRRERNHYVSEMLQQGIIAADDIEQAITRAIRACVVAGMPVHRHFQLIYVCAEEIQKDWLVSDLACQLIVLNANAANYITARIQAELLSNYFAFAGVLHLQMLHLKRQHSILLL
jgi:hypothetical protein